MQGPATSQYRQSTRLLERILVAVVSAIGHWQPRGIAATKGANVKRCAVIAGLVIAMGLAGVSTSQPAQAATTEKAVRYGPFVIPAGTDADPGMVHNKLMFGVQRPCIDCYITSFTPDLVYADGSRANMDTGPMLHHMVLTSQWRRDATCGSSWLGLAGERFFASGNERTAIKFPAGYGYRVRYYDAWNLLVDLMNDSAEAKTVYVKVTYTTRPSWEPVQRLRPVWLDIDQCGDSEYSIPAGYSDTPWDWTVNVPGKVVAMIGHLHGHGVYVEATNQSQGGKSICKSVATLDPDDVHSVLAMSTCTGDPLAVVRLGQTVRLHSVYDSPHAADDVMGIMLGYIHPSS
jgi:Stress up-regulated Nod 19